MDANTFNLEHQYQLFLGRMSLSEPTLHPVQSIQLRQAFMGGCGQMFFLFRDEIFELDEQEGITALESLLQQMENYWNDQVKNSLPNN